MKKYIVTLTTILFLLILMGGVRQTQAADAVVGNGTPASCTEAVFANALLVAGNGGGTVTFDCGPAVKTITLTSTKFMNMGDVTINGEDRIILNANNIDRHFFVGNGITFELQAITLRDGSSGVGGGAIEASGATVVLDGVQLLNNYASVSGGAIYCYDGTLIIQNSWFENNSAATGGALFNDGCVVGVHNSTFQGNQALDTFGRGGAMENAPLGIMTVTHTLLQANSAPDGGGLFVASGATAVLDGVTFSGNSGGYGGGVENSGDLTLINSVMESNTVSGSGGGLWNMGGTAVIQQTSFNGNTAYEGGGVNSYGTQLEMQDVNFVDNTANGSDGGGLYHIGGTAYLTNATFDGNFSVNNGGGIFQSSDDNMTLTNVTLVNNHAGNFGGAFYHYGRYAILTNVTLGDNLAGVAGDAIYEDSPMTAGSPGVVQIGNSVIFGSANNCDGGLFQSFGHNISSGSCAALSHPSDQENYGGSLLLGELAYNGGVFSMQTILPQAGSPLIDAADSNECASLDQRSANRVGICDIGAVEYGAMAFRVYLPMIVR